MLVSHRHKFIYTKTIKTASTSVEIFFEPACRCDRGARRGALTNELVDDAGIVGYCGPDRRGKQWFDHQSAKSIKNGLGDEIWNDYFKFCIIRNPFDKLVSAYHFYDWLVNYYSGLDKAKLMFCHGLLPGKPKNEVKRFRRWVAWTFWFHDRNNYQIDDQLCVDFFIRYESLLEDIEKVCAKVKFPFKPEQIKKLNTNIRPAIVRLLNTTMRRQSKLFARGFVSN